jgi:hypothetical protein
MNDLTQQLLTDLDLHRASVRAAIDSVPVEWRERRPAEGRWSVAEVLEHLFIIEGRVTKMLAMAAETAAPAGEGEREKPAIDMVRLLDRTQPVMGPEPVQPCEGLDSATAWQRLQETRVELRRVVEAAAGRDLSGIVRTHPILGDMHMYQWIAVIGGHEARHALQIREAGELLRAQPEDQI